MSYTERSKKLNEVDISRLDTLRKIGQIVVPRLDFRTQDYMTLAKALIAEYRVGGFIIFGGDRKSVPRALEELEDLSELPLLFGCDAERGLGQIVSGMARFPFTMSLGAAGDDDLVYREALSIAEELRECGLNLIFAPVLDVNSNPNNPIINIRSYGDDPLLVSRLGSAFIRGCRDGGVLSCGKHFPGHGSAGVDSHSDLPVLDLTLEQLAERDLIPFEIASDSDVDMIMTAHVALPRITGGMLPATISGEIINGILRERLGYDGAVITDSFNMSGINKLGDDGDLSHLALNAGCDITLDPREPYLLLGRLNDMALTGELNPAVLHKAAARVIALKKTRLFGAVRQNKPAENGQALSETIASRSVCLIRGRTLRPRRALVCTFDITQSGKEISTVFTGRLRDAGVECETVTVGMNSDFNKLYSTAARDGAVICLVFTTIGAWQNNHSVPGLLRSSLEQLAAVAPESALLSFGSPYVVSGLDKFGTVICAFDSLAECQRAAADALLGLAEAPGKLPVKI